MRRVFLTAMLGAATAGLLSACGDEEPRTVTQVVREQTTTVERTVTETPPGTAARTGPRIDVGGRLGDAEARVRSEGYDVIDRSGYDPRATLRVLIGVKQGSADGYSKKAFFFVGPEFIGTDTKDPSAQIRVGARSDTTVTLAYAIYRRRDGLCCPSGGSASVRYYWNGARLAPQDPIPSLAERGQA
jgi:hypothetical protein